MTVMNAAARPFAAQLIGFRLKLSNLGITGQRCDEPVIP